MTKRKTRILAGAALFGVILAFTGFAKNAPKENGLGIQLKLDRRVLSNGLVVILVEDHTVPIVSYQTWYRVGSVDEHLGKTGISHLFEHLMFKGTPKYGPKQFFQQLEAKGADVNAFTTRDYTVYYESFVSNLLDKVIDMESDRMANLTLNDEVLNTERAVVFEERKLRTDDSPDGRMQEALWQLAYRRHPYQWPVIGYPQDLLGISVEDLTAYFKSHYQPANAALVVVGDFQTEETFKAIKTAYEAVPADPRPKRDLPTEPEQKEERRLVLRDSVASEKFAQAYHVTSAMDDDSYALDVLANILFEGTSSRAYRKLVDDMDLTDGISGSAYTPTYPGLFIISATMKSGVKTDDAEQALWGVIRQLQDTGVTDEEIRVAVKQLTVQLVDSVRTPYGLGQLIGTVQTIFGDPQRFSEDLSKYLKVTKADVKRVAQTYLQPNNRSVVVLVPGGGPTPSPSPIPTDSLTPKHKVHGKAKPKDSPKDMKEKK
jgi:zinc protease